ncbi:hypothetical protein BCR33DRAFT_813730 [Rhizoclosmatium globosum]|uniref:Wax synthase domain-containing protein n=1 Tax=Rhizoclosmatium globosum TaxID=329046 RepID=A0A1Y2CES6_9FUNG|nr:hypothetical protein BCR33DRAFT_813730 [Rhizoclosmatium globosum]|eukprot:ORY45522.1 hypothetical protein BCR33DRAFT_813730 [Rhizoclosmatium globosum]
MIQRQYGLTLLPAWLSFLLILTVLPSIHFHALKSGLPSWQVATIGVLLFVTIPVMFPCEDWSSDLMVKGLFVENFIYHTLDIAYFPQALTSKWTFKEYAEYMITAENESVRRYEAKVLGEDKRRQVNKGRSVAWKDQNTIFLITMALRLIFDYGIIVVVSAFHLKYPYGNCGTILNPFDTHCVAHQIMYAVFGSASIDITFVGVVLPLTWLVQGNFTLPSHSFFLASSLQDFWSNRWNFTFTVSMRRTVFLPVLNFLRGAKHSKEHKTNKFHAFIACMCVFFVSGLKHEAFLIGAMGEAAYKHLFASTGFFIIQGLLFSASLVIKKSIGFGVTWGTGLAGDVSSRLLTVCALMIAAPMFVYPHVDSGYVV